MTPDELVGRYPHATDTCEIKMWLRGEHAFYRYTMIGDHYDTYGNAMTFDECVARMDAIEGHYPFEAASEGDDV